MLKFVDGVLDKIEAWAYRLVGIGAGLPSLEPGDDVVEEEAGYFTEEDWERYFPDDADAYDPFYDDYPEEEHGDGTL